MENQSTTDKLRSMQAGNVVVLSRDEARILKTLDRSNTIRTRPVRPDMSFDSKPMWEAWFEFQEVHEADMQQITGRGVDIMICQTCGGRGKSVHGLTCGNCNGLGKIL